MSKDNKPSWRALGEYFGYPDCCIDYFIKNCSPIAGWHNIRDIHWSAGTGFIPCTKCRSLPQSIVLASIYKRRQSPEQVPFVNIMSLSKSEVRKVLELHTTHYLKMKDIIQAAPQSIPPKLHKRRKGKRAMPKELWKKVPLRGSSGSTITKQEAGIGARLQQLLDYTYRQ